MHYRFGDWTIDCPIDLPDLVPFESIACNASDNDRGGVGTTIRHAAGETRPFAALEPDLTLRVLPVERRLSRPHRWLHHWLDNDGFRMLSMARRADGSIQLRFPGQLDARFDPSQRTLVLRLLDGCQPATCQHLLIDQLLPRIRSAYSALVIHACAVRIGESAIVIAGESGWGKSTLAAALHSQGHEVLSDDCVILRIEDGAVRVRSTYPSLRLLPDSLALLDEPDVGATMTEASSKQRIRLQHEVTQIEQKATALYLLQAPAACDEIQILPQPLATECIELMRQAFVLDVTDRPAHARQLQHASAVAQVLPAFTLAFPRAYDRLPDVVKCLIAHSRNAAVSPSPRCY